MTFNRIAAIALALVLAVPAAQAVETTLQIQLGTGGGTDFERRTMVYDCSVGDPINVEYINAAPNFLAFVPVDGETEKMIFTAVIAASGVKYAAGQWVWWTKGPDASLYDLTLGEDAEAVKTCSEVVNTP